MRSLATVLGCGLLLAAPGLGQQQCCCVPATEQCGDPSGQEDLAGLGFIDARIVNRPSVKEDQTACPAGQNTCCYNPEIDLSVFGRTCITPEQANGAAQGFWKQSCSERVTTGGKECGTRPGYTPTPGRLHGQANPGEFPWVCLILTKTNDFIGSCAVVPADFNNNNNNSPKIITAAHKLLKVTDPSTLKVRVGEYDASGSTSIETLPHKEYDVSGIKRFPGFNRGRLSQNMAILTTVTRIDISPNNVNTACFPSCNDQFSFRFNNGTGSRCWVAGWGKDEVSGKFQVIQRKVDVPLVDEAICESGLKKALDAKKAGLGSTFKLDASEICAGAEVGKDACTGDGGSPLVCQSVSGRWTVVGLVAWGVGCAQDIPGVYARISYFRDWIAAN